MSEYQKGKLNILKRQKNIIFRSVGFAVLKDTLL